MRSLKRFIDPFRRRPDGPRSGRLVRRYFMISVLLISGGLLASGVVQIYYSYKETLQQLALLQQEKADGAALRIDRFIFSIEQGLRTVAKSRELAVKGISQDFRFEMGRLLRVLPPIMDLVAIPLSDMGPVQVSRFKPVFPSQPEDKRYRETISSFQTDKTLNLRIGRVEFARDSEPHVGIAVPLERYPGHLLGALFADVDLRYVADVIGNVAIGKKGYAYVVTNMGDLIAHPDMSLVLQRKNVGTYSQVKHAFDDDTANTSRQSIQATNFRGEKVFSSFARIPGLNWAVIVEQPAAEINETIYSILLRTSGLLLLGLGTALFASVLVARRVVRPLEILGVGVQRIGRGDLDHRLEIKTGDEIETLADEFNKMVGKLNASYHVLEDQVRQRTSEITALFDVTRIATQSLNIESVLGQVAEKIKDLFNLDNVRIYSFAQNQDAIPLRAMAGQFDTSIDLAPLRRGSGIIAKVAESGEPRIFNDIHNDPSYDELSQNGAAKALGFRFFAVIPIKLKGKVLGIIACNGRSARVLSEEEQRLLVALADPIGPVLENLHLFEELNEKSSELETANRELMDSLAQQTAVAGTLRVMAGSPSNLQAVFDAILADAASLTQATGGVVRLLDGAGTLRFVAHYGRSGQSLAELQRLPLPADENSATTKAMRERRPVQIDDIQKHGPEWRVPVAPGPWHTALAIPLLQDNEAIGVIVVFRDIVEPFTDQQIELLSTFADQAVIAIKNTTLFQELQARTRELELANERLTQLDKLKSGFLSNVSHELKTPLTAIGSLVDNMIDGLTGPLNDKQAHYIGGIKESTERLTRLIHDLLDISVIESGRIELKLSPFSVPELIGEVAESLTPVAEQKSISLVLPSANGDAMARADRDKIAQVLTNLIGNAVKFTPPNGKVELGLEKSDDGRWIEVAVSDTGPGIPPKEARLIFDEFYQIHQPGWEKIKGVGLGLAICKKLIDMHGGNISLTSEIGQGSTFHFTLPAHRVILEVKPIEATQS